MKAYFALSSLLCLFVLAAGSGRAETAPASPAAPQELAVVVVDSLGGAHGAITAFDRLDIAFTNVAKQRKWPIKIVAERFAANTPSHTTELRIFYKGIRADTPDEMVFRAWVTFADPSVKKDFGIIAFHYYPRPGEQQDDVLDKIFLGAANAIADNIEPILFPEGVASKP